MKTPPSNIYESDDSSFTEETERLASFDLPTKISIETVGEICPGASILDIGAGPNTQLGSYVQSHGGNYVALDKNPDFLKKQKAASAETFLGDIRSLPFQDESFDICHVRFVISHLGKDKLTSIREALRVTKPTGEAIFIEYDWTTAHGSSAFDKVKDFMVNGDFLFDAGYGHELEDEVRNAVNDSLVLNVVDYDAPRMLNYSQVLKLREAGTTDLKLQGKETAAEEWNELLDALQLESESDNPPGFFFPGLKVVKAMYQ